MSSSSAAAAAAPSSLVDVGESSRAVVFSGRMVALCEKARGFKSELARRARGDGSGRDALPDDRLRELLCDTYEDLASEACSVLEKAVAEGAVEERDVDEAVEELDGAAAAAAAAQVDSTEQAKRRKLLEAHRGTTDIHLDPKYEERARKLAAFDFPGKPYAELHLDIKRKLGTEARGEHFVLQGRDGGDGRVGPILPDGRAGVQRGHDGACGGARLDQGGRVY